ncbi:MAG: HAD family hydrolase [Ilumatobacter sp.]|nr:HAD family hydrolase [Ilumatobacter sp.]
MPSRVEMIVSDLDGTLFDRSSNLSERTIRAVRSAHGAGIRVVAATGRSSTSAAPRLRPAHVISTAICSNGSLVHDVHEDRNLHRFHIDAEHVERLFQRLAAHDPRLSFCWETDHGNGWDEDFADVASGHEDLGRLATLTDRPTRSHRVTKIMVRHPDVVRGELRDRLLPHLGDPLTVSCSGVDFVEVTGVGVDKSTGLQHLCDEWSIDPADVVAFGDNQNDLAMLSWAGRSVAVANASEAVLGVADDVIGHHDDDAVAVEIEAIVEQQRSAAASR